jgi:hypothetical protein
MPRRIDIEDEWEDDEEEFESVIAIAVVQQAIAPPAPSDALHLLTLVTIALCALLYGAGKKLADLTEEHGLRAYPFRGIAYVMVGAGLLGLVPFTAGTTLLVADVAFHGAIKAKADRRGLFWCAVGVLAIVLVVVAALPAGRVDWPTVEIVLVTSVACMWLNNRVLRLGDNLFHMVRGDRMLVFFVLSWIDPVRWVPFAVAILVEPCAYGATKLLAMRSAWYRDGIVTGDRDPFGIAFHRDR